MAKEDRGWAIENLRSGNWLRVVDGAPSWPGDWRERTIFTNRQEVEDWKDKFLDVRVVTVWRSKAKRIVKPADRFDDLTD